MPKHYKEMIDEIINKMDESKIIEKKELSADDVRKKYGKDVYFTTRMKTRVKGLEPNKKGKYHKFIKGGMATVYPNGRVEFPNGDYIDEDAPTNSVASGGVDMNPTGARMSPKMMRRKKEQGDKQDDITKKISKMIKQNEDNNNVILKQVNEGLSKVEDKSDEKLGLKQDVDIEEKEYKTFRDRYNA